MLHLAKFRLIDGGVSWHIKRMPKGMISVPAPKHYKVITGNLANLVTKFIN